jgi:hypothetical protein
MGNDFLVYSSKSNCFCKKERPEWQKNIPLSGKEQFSCALFKATCFFVESYSEKNAVNHFIFVSRKRPLRSDMHGFTALYRKDPVVEFLQYFHFLFFFNQFFKFSPADHTLPIGEILSVICLETYFWVFLHDIHFYSFTRMSINIGVVKGIADRHYIGNVIAMAPDAPYELADDQLVNLHGIQFPKHNFEFNIRS